MKQVHNPLLLCKNDYEIILRLLREGTANTTFNRQDAEELLKELKRAKVVAAEDLPHDVVRLYATVTIKDQQSGNTMVLQLVTPGKADIKQKKISILSPVGTALIGFSKGQKVSWKVPAGWRTFTILDVTNPVPQQEAAA
jgi:regulator of nucleoside diphosphate kinase